MEAVSFSYRADAARETSPDGPRDGQRPAAISNLDLVIPAGATVAIVGASGAGKSTIADLVTGLLAPDSGKVMVDDTVLDAASAGAWRAQVGYVSQDTYLFHDTVRANLLWARPGASEAELREALAAAAAEEFVDALPEGLETLVGDRGASISHGERQRIALARALLRRPRLLILDEATNSLDAHNEERILDAIERLHGNVTIVTIAHRIAAVRRADRIYLVEAGTIAESGTWEELSGREHGRFRALCESQGITPGPLSPRLVQPARRLA